MDDLWVNIADKISLIGAFFILGFVLCQSQIVTKNVMKNIEQFGSDEEGKRIVAAKAIFNFYLFAIAIIIIVTGSLKLIGTELFIVLLMATLTGLGIKLSFDTRGK